MQSSTHGLTGMDTLLLPATAGSFSGIIRSSNHEMGILRPGASLNGCSERVYHAPKAQSCETTLATRHRASTCPGHLVPPSTLRPIHGQTATLRPLHYPPRATCHLTIQFRTPFQPPAIHSTISHILFFL